MLTEASDNKIRIAEMICFPLFEYSQRKLRCGLTSYLKVFPYNNIFKLQSYTYGLLLSKLAFYIQSILAIP